MAGLTGSARLVLFLLCCMGTLLSSHPASIRDCDLEGIIRELQVLSEKLLENYNERGVSPYELQSFSSYCQTPRTFNNSAILPYFKAIRRISNDNTTIDETIQQLSKCKRGPETEVSVPTDNFERKSFILAVLNEFSMCMKLLSP